MVTVDDIITNFPQVLPSGNIEVEESHEFVVLDYEDGSSSTKYKYLLNKAPVERVDKVTGTVDGSAKTFTEGTDYQVIDDNGDGNIDTIDFGIGGDDPDDNTEFEVTYVAESIFSRYVGAHDDEFDKTRTKLNDVISSRDIDQASGADLNRMGAIFGELGRRRGRDDPDYRAFLKSIVQSFKGRGTKPGMKFAIAAGIGTSTENITITEDFTEVGYEIQIDNVDTDFLSGAVNDMAQLADPSGVELLSPPVILLDGSTLVFTMVESSVTSSTTGLGGDTLTLDGNSTLQ